MQYNETKYVNANGEQFSWNVKITNEATATQIAVNARANFVIPAGVSVVSFSEGGYNNTTKQWSAGNVGIGETKTAVMVLQVNDISKLPTVLSYTVVSDTYESSANMDDNTNTLWLGTTAVEPGVCLPESPQGHVSPIAYSMEVGSAAGRYSKCSAGARARFEAKAGSFVNIDETRFYINPLTSEYYAPRIDQSKPGYFKMQIVCVLDGVDYGPFPADGSLVTIVGDGGIFNGTTPVAINSSGTLTLAQTFLLIDGAAGNASIQVPDAVADSMPLWHRIDFTLTTDPGANTVKFTGPSGVEFYGYGSEIGLMNIPLGGYMIHLGSNKWSVFGLN